ncbi:hypothetical protein OIV83_005445 [Microbotryomycetes sp. JL201]|nr:hypothetical protein OIV83_005445 [Microbotryomycetes sp. JL201]
MSGTLKRHRSSSPPADSTRERLGPKDPTPGPSAGKHADEARTQIEASSAFSRIQRRRSMKPAELNADREVPSICEPANTSGSQPQATGVPRSLSHSPESAEDKTEEIEGDASLCASMTQGRLVVEDPESALPSDMGHPKHIFELEVVQQPEVGAEAGSDSISVGRLPIVPAPIVRLRVRDPEGHEIDDGETPYMFCSCSLKREWRMHAGNPSTTEDLEAKAELSALIGSTVRTSHQVMDLDGAPASYYVFDDVSVRTTGTFRLEFTLAEARRPKSPKLAAAVSEPFEVVPRQFYPGRPADGILTPLSRHLYDQGIPLYLPPLVLNPIGPPPPSSNPFPPDQLRELSRREEYSE